jgi:hypothetical protein
LTAHPTASLNRFNDLRRARRFETPNAIASSPSVRRRTGEDSVRRLRASGAGVADPFFGHLLTSLMQDDPIDPSVAVADNSELSIHVRVEELFIGLRIDRQLGCSGLDHHQFPALFQELEDRGGLTYVDIATWPTSL